jgi:hypothetical protein
MMGVSDPWQAAAVLFGHGPGESGGRVQMG